MGNALTMFDDKKTALPAHLRNFLDEAGDNIGERSSVPSLTFTGKTWTISVNGEKTKLVKKDEDGDEVPLAIMRVVVLDFAKKRGRQFYEGEYDPATVKQPTCWSEDGVLVHASVPEDQVQTPKERKCEFCPLAVKGSKISPAGKAVVACGQFRMLAVVPANNLSHPPLRMKIAVTSDWDKQSPDWEAQGYFAFNNYTDFLRTKGVTHTAVLVTKMRFDPEQAYPKIMFSADKWLTEAQLEILKPVVISDDVKKLISGAFTPAGGDGVATTQAAIEKPAAKPAKAAAVPVEDEDDDAPVVRTPKAASKKAPVTLDGDDDDVQAVVAKPVAAPAKKAKTAPVIEDEDEDEEEATRVAAAHVKKPAKAAPVVEDDEEEEAAPVAPAKKAKAAVVIEDDEDDEEAAPVVAKAQGKAKSVDKAPVKATQATTSVPDDVSSLLDEWVG